MIKRKVTCDHCGKELKDERPYRVMVQQPSQHTYTDYFGEPHVRKTYEPWKTFHICSKCRKHLEEFMGAPLLERTQKDE